MRKKFSTLKRRHVIDGRDDHQSNSNVCFDNFLVIHSVLFLASTACSDCRYTHAVAAVICVSYLLVMTVSPAKMAELIETLGEVNFD